MHVQDFSPVDLQQLGIRTKAWRNKNVSMLHMRRIFLLLTFSNSGSVLKHGEIKRENVAHAQDFSPVDLQPLGTRPKLKHSKIRNGNMLCMRRIFLLLIFIPLRIRPKAWRNKNVSLLRMLRI